MSAGRPGAVARRGLGVVLALAMRRPVLTVALFAAVLRLLAMAQIPLLITNDGVGYAMWAEEMLGGRWPDLPVFRTPGYPVALAGAFAIGGVGPWPVLVMHHAMGVATCALVAVAARRAAGPGAALVCGVLAAMDMRLLGFESYLLTEAPATFLVVCAMALALGGRWPVARCAALGAVLAAMCLVRPALQILVPFLGAAAVAPMVGGAGEGLRLRARRLLPAAAAMAIAFSVVAGPWLVYNARRGVTGFSGASSVFFWLGARKAGVLEGTQPPQEVRPAWDRLLAGEPAHSDRVYPFLVQSGAWSSDEVREALARWRREAIAQRPGRSLAAVGRATLWQLDIYPSPPPGSETRWLMRRLAAPPEIAHKPPLAQSQMNWDGEAFASSRRGGAMARVVAFCAGGDWSGILNVILALAAAAALALSVLRRRWAVALALLGLFACFGAHVLTLLPYSRFGLPFWVSWYVAPAVVWGLWRARMGPMSPMSPMSPMGPMRDAP